MLSANPAAPRQRVPYCTCCRHRDPPTCRSMDGIGYGSMQCLWLAAQKWRNRRRSDDKEKGGARITEAMEVRGHYLSSTNKSDTTMFSVTETVGKTKEMFCIEINETKRFFG